MVLAEVDAAWHTDVATIDPAPKLEPTSTKWQAHRCWHKICCAAQNHWNTQGHMSEVSNQVINKHVYDNQCAPALCALQWTNKQ